MLFLHVVVSSGFCVFLRKKHVWGCNAEERGAGRMLRPGLPLPLGRKLTGN